MINVPASYLLNELDEETALRVMEAMQGCRVYFPTKAVLYHRIKKDFENMNATSQERYRALAYSYEMSVCRVKEIVNNKDKSIFDVGYST